MNEDFNLADGLVDQEPRMDDAASTVPAELVEPITDDGDVDADLTEVIGYVQTSEDLD